MANQYSQSFENILMKKYGKPAQEVLKSYSSEGLSYEEVAQRFGIKATTVRKWCRKYSIQLSGGAEQLNLEDCETLYQSTLNAVSESAYHVLYRSWAIDHSALLLKQSS